MSKIRRRSARALAKKVWNVVVNTNQKKVRRSSLSDDSKDGKHTLSISSNGSSQTEQKIVDRTSPVQTNTEDDINSCTHSVEVENHNVTDEECYESNYSNEENDVSSHTAEATAQPLLDKENKVEFEDTLELLFDITSSSATEEGANIVSQAPGIYEEDSNKMKSDDTIELLVDSSALGALDRSTDVEPPSADKRPPSLEDSNKEKEFVKGAVVRIIKGTHKGKGGIITRVTSKCAFISINGIHADVRKTKSVEFLEISDQNEIHERTTVDADCRTEVQEMFLPGKLVCIKKGTYKDRHGVISRLTDKSVFVTIKGLTKDVRKKRSAEFLEIVNNVPQESQHISEQANVEEKDVFVAGLNVMIVKGNHLGKCGVISRVTSKSTLVSIAGEAKDVRKTKSNTFLRIVVDPTE